MRFRKIDRYLLLLTGLFVLAVLRPTDLPGEEVLPDVYRAAIHQPFLAQAANVVAEPELELAELRSELEAARFQVRALKTQLNARAELQAYFREVRWPNPPVAIPGFVFQVESDVYRRTFRVACDQSEGVGAGMPVVTGKALLGVVILVLKHHSVVRRVDDPNFRIEVQVDAGDDAYVPGVAVGTGSKGLEVLYLRAAGRIKVGAKVFTSSHDEFVPAGLLVGTVESVDDEERDGMLEVRVKPAAALGHLAQVDVLKLEWPK